MMRTRVGVVSAWVAVLVLSGCAAGSSPTQAPGSSESSPTASVSAQTATPSAAAGDPAPSQTPAPTAIEGGPAVITDDAVGDVVVGKPVDGGAFVSWDANACGGEQGAWDTAPGDPAGQDSFSVTTVDFKKSTVVDNIIVFAPTIQTSTGVHPGSTRAELLAAYPTFSKVYKNDQTDLYVLENATAQTVFEVLSAQAKGTDPKPDTVLFITVERASNKAHSIYATDAAGPCPG